MAYVNIRGLKKEIAGQYSKSFRRIMERKIKRDVAQVKRQMISEFNQHSVTKDIEGQSGGGLSSGNLFSFIGFNQGDAPTNRLRALLLDSLKVSITRVLSTEVQVNFTVHIPSQAEIEAASPMPWAAGRSWAREIEIGIPGLGQYFVKDSPSSRSGKAIQVKGIVRQGNYSARPYMTQVIGNMIKNLTKTLEAQ